MSNLAIPMFCVRPVLRIARRRGCADRARAGSRRNTGCCLAPRIPAIAARPKRSVRAAERRKFSALSGDPCARDVIQADGGTRTASITGGFVALWRACATLKRAGTLSTWPIREHIAAISCGVYAGKPVLDLDYAEDSVAGADGNFVLTESGALVEAQASAEGEPFARDQFEEMIRLAEKGVGELITLQKAAIGVGA